MKIKSSHTCLTIILEDGRKFSLDFEDNFYLSSNELSDEELTIAMLATFHNNITCGEIKHQVFPLHFSYFGKTIDSELKDGRINVLSNVEITEDVKRAVSALSAGIVYASLDAALKPLSPGLEGALAFKNGFSIHTNPYRNKDFAESDQWLAGWNLAASFKPSSKISGINV